MNNYTPALLPSNFVTPVPSSASSVSSSSGNGSDPDVSVFPNIPASNQQYLNMGTMNGMNLSGAQVILPNLMNPNTPHHPIAEFLYQLTKMLTDDNNEIIEWTQGRIKVHHPERLAGEVLHKYFRHSKYASFQRQLNYFGFRKIAGKGKMSPCSYVNDAATDDLRSLLLIKRKTNGSAARKAGAANGTKRSRSESSGTKNETVGSPTLCEADLPTVVNPTSQPAGARKSFPVPQLVPASVLPNAFPTRNSTSANEQQQQPLVQRQTNEHLHFPSESTLASLARGTTTEQLKEATLHSAKPLLNPLVNPMTMGMGNGGAPQDQLPSAPISVASTMPCPATAALNAAALASTQTSALFDSTPNLKKLLTEHSSNAQKPQTNATNASHTGQYLLSSLPSSNSIFPENFSSASLTQLVGRGGSGNNRIPSFSGLNNFLSRDSSLIDLAMLPTLPGVASSQCLVGGGGIMEPTPIQDMQRQSALSGNGS